MNPVTIFSWGYWGWGNATEKFMRAVDAVEKSRGFDPPLFVDIRISRGGRAQGFKGTAFEETVGHDRYVWMDDLGNESIRTGAGRISIKNPNAAEVLLMLAAENARRRRRVIFFCSCEWPKWPGGHCHRANVASLLLKAAARRDLSVDVIEWPGGAPETMLVTLSRANFQKSQTATAIPLDRTLPEPDLLGLPWGSIVEIRTGQDISRHFVGPARFRGGRWFLPKLYDELENEVSPERGLHLGATWRKRWDFEPRRISTAH